MIQHVVSGGAGFIGSQLVDRLLATSGRVVAIDDLSMGSRRFVSDLGLRSGQLAFVENDINAIDNVCEAIDNVGPTSGDAIFWHLAANSDIRAGVADPAIDFERTLRSTVSSLSLCRRLGIRRFLLASTSAVYGETAGLLAEDSGPLLPISNYGAMKLASEAAVSAAVTSELDVAWIVRFPNVVGPRATHGVILDFIRRLRANPKTLEVLGNGTQQKPYLHVEDLLDAITLIVEKGRSRRNLFNVGPNGLTTVREIAEWTVARCAPSAHITYGHESCGWPGDVPAFEYSTEAIRALHWQPRWCSSDAVRLAIEAIAKQVFP